jgi:CheY-like chemotaxis protein
MGQKRIFVLEDNDVDVGLIRKALENLDADVTVAGDAETAVRELNQFHAAGRDPDLIILDIELPGESGLSVLRKLRKGRFRAVPIIMFTSSDSLLQREEAEALGIAAYIAKPIELGEYLQFGETVRRLLVEGLSQSPRRLSPGGYGLSESS